jgi:hypothetical protein
LANKIFNLLGSSKILALIKFNFIPIITYIVLCLKLSLYLYIFLFFPNDGHLGMEERPSVAQVPPFD